MFSVSFYLAKSFYLCSVPSLSHLPNCFYLCFPLLCGPLSVTIQYTDAPFSSFLHFTLCSVCVRNCFGTAYRFGTKCFFGKRNMASKLRRAPLFKYEGNLCVRSVFPESKNDVSFFIYIFVFFFLSAFE